MATTEEVVRDLNAKMMRAEEAAKEILDHARDERRALTGEEKQSWDRAIDEADGIRATVDAFVTDETRTKEREAVNEAFREAAAPAEIQDRRGEERRQLAEFCKRGGSITNIAVNLDSARRMYEAHRNGADAKELRLIGQDSSSASGGSLVIPTDLESSVYQYMTASVAARRMGPTVISTPGGNPIDFPRIATHGIATQVANEDTALAGTDFVLGKMTLNAYDSGQLYAVANNTLDDAGVNILELVFQQLGRAIGEHTAAWYVAGTGSGQPMGIFNAAGIGSVNTGGSLINPDLDDFIDLEFSLTDTYRQRAVWLMRDATAKIVRKFRDGAGGTVGAFLWEPSPTRGLIEGQPDRFMGYPVFTDPNVASLASNARVVAFLDPKVVYIRDVGNLDIERSDDLLFNKDQVAFRGKLRTDSDVIDANGVAVIKVNV